MRQKARIEALSDVTHQQQARQRLGVRPEEMQVGSIISTEMIRGGESVFWGDGVKPVDQYGQLQTDVAYVRAGPLLHQGASTLVPLEYPPMCVSKASATFGLIS